MQLESSLAYRALQSLRDPLASAETIEILAALIAMNAAHPVNVATLEAIQVGTYGICRLVDSKPLCGEERRHDAAKTAALAAICSKT